MPMTDGHISDGRRIRAFTLVEMIVVMVVVGVVESSTIPRYAGFDALRHPIDPRVRYAPRRLVEVHEV